MRITSQSFLIICIQVILPTLFATVVVGYVAVLEQIDLNIIGMSLGFVWLIVLGMLIFIYKSSTIKELEPKQLKTAPTLGFNFFTFQRLVLVPILGLSLWAATIMSGINPDLISRGFLLLVLVYFGFYYYKKKSK